MSNKTAWMLLSSVLAGATLLFFSMILWAEESLLQSAAALGLLVLLLVYVFVVMPLRQSYRERCQAEQEIMEVLIEEGESEEEAKHRARTIVDTWQEGGWNDLS